MRLRVIAILLSIIPFGQIWSQAPASIKEYKKSFVTYPFSDPDPIASQTAIYPYYRFDGFTNKPVNKSWTVVELENDYIKVVILPEIGGKIWTAIDKTTGKEFLYNNKVIKFRDIAMRGPWTSGGLEANYGIIGHTPNCATPVDYSTKNNVDGSVSCFIGVLDLLTRTNWQIEINLPKNKAYFTTNSIWNNNTSIGQPYYHWMNAGIKTKGNLEFIYPGTNYIGHGGEYASWPTNEDNGKRINFYEENDFGTYKSYHVIGKQTDFFGAYWHDDNYGMVRYAPYDNKAGKKIWIWGLSRQGMIWEKILTDTDGQYAEIQSGRLFNQNAQNSSFTPFKHLSFTPHGTDTWKEYWYPVNKTNGIVVAGEFAALNVKIENGFLKWYCSPVAFFNDTLEIHVDGKLLVKKAISAKPIQTIIDSIKIGFGKNDLSISLKKQQLTWKSDPNFNTLSRPLETPTKFEWNSAEGLVIQGKELMDQKMFSEAEIKLNEALAKEPYHLMGLVKLAELYIRNGEDQKAFEISKTAISVDAHHGAANYYYGLSAARINKEADAIDGFSIATMSVEYKSAALTELAKIHAQHKRWDKVLTYASQAIDFNTYNADAVALLIIANRKLGNSSIAKQLITQLEKEQPLNLHVKWNNNKFGGFKNELPEESILELASFYGDIKLESEVAKILEALPNHPLAIYWKAYLQRSNNNHATELLNKANSASTTLIFPFRTSFIPILQWAAQNSTSWKPNYYLALLLHDKNKKAAALEMLTALGSTPTDAHVYGLRAQWNTTNLITKEADLQKAISLDPNGWRYYKLLTQLYIQNKDYEKALAIVEKFKQSNSQENFIMDMLLAKSLLLNKKYKECDKLLSTMEVIPFEGSTDGRALYWEAKMMQGVAALNDKNYTSAIQFVHEAQEWPENLGAGKPYEADIDNRLEQYLQYICLNALHQSDSAQALLKKITAFKPGIYNTIRNFQPANHLITKWAYNDLHESFDWNDWMQTQISKYPQFKETLNWVLSKANNSAESINSVEDPWMRVIQEIMNTPHYNKNDAYIFIQKPERRNEQTKWELVWEDNFNNGYLDTTHWSKIGLFSTPKWKMPKEKWRDNTGCFRYITDTDDRVVQFDAENILLRGIVNNDTINGDPRPMLTGGIYSYNKFAFQYGRIEVRAKLDPAHGAWPAIWMLSEKDIYPDQNNGEMDIMERLNHDSFAYQTTHNHATITLKQETPKKYNTGKIDPSGYNTYSVSWYPDKLVYAINGIETITYPKVAGGNTYQWPFDQPFYLIIDQQLEGSWPGKVTNLKELPINMTVDWVKLYQ
jgi:beta-glucanase (GH16 family)/Tfp pilus assembly protein PilF